MPRKCLSLEYLGEVKTLSQWAKQFDIPYSRLLRRYNAGKSQGLLDAEILGTAIQNLNSGDRKQETYGSKRSASSASLSPGRPRKYPKEGDRQRAWEKRSGFEQSKARKAKKAAWARESRATKKQVKRGSVYMTDMLLAADLKPY